MRIALYGMPGAGKSTILGGLRTLEVVNGSQMLNVFARERDGLPFRELDPDVQCRCRDDLINWLRAKDAFIIDGHYAFGDQVVFTEGDGGCYDVFLYLYEDPAVLRERMERSEKNRRYLGYDLAAWQRREIEGLREFCLRNGKDFYVIDRRASAHEFIEAVLAGFSCVGFAEKAVRRILSEHGGSTRIVLLDGDRTVTTRDAARELLDYRTDIFDNNFYTGFQFWEQAREFARAGEYEVDLSRLPRNDALLGRLAVEDCVVLTCGLPRAWEELSRQLGIRTCISGAEMSADTKYHIARGLQKAGLYSEIETHGDSLCDWFMLRQTQGTLWTGFHPSRSLVGRDLVQVQVRRVPFVLQSERPDPETDRLCRLSRSDSGLEGNALAEVHCELGERLGRVLAERYDPLDVTLVCFLRSGLFLACGIFRTFNCKFKLFNPSHDDPSSLEVGTETVLLVDAVANTGRSLMDFAGRLDGKQIVVATLVTQRKTLSCLSEYPVYTCRVSDNSYRGAHCTVQRGDVGPDTSERLFNLLHEA